MNAKKPESDEKGRLKPNLAGTLKGVGLRSPGAVKLLRKLLEAGHVQRALEGVAEVLLSEAVLSGKVPTNAGRPTQDLALAAEAAIADVVDEYHMAGNPLTSRHVPPLGLVAEMCKQWIVGFAPPIPNTFSLKRGLEDPEVQDRLGVVALKAREIILQTSDTYDSTGSWESSEVRFSGEKLEDLCRKLSLLLFLAFEHPNEINHELIHGEKP